MSLSAGACGPRASVRASALQGQSPRQLSQVCPPIRAPLSPGQAVADFRFWHDEKRFRGSGDDSLAQHTLLAAGGVRMGGNPKSAPVQGPMGWQVVDRWDLLWSTSDGAHKAAPLIQPGQLINALPGLESLTRKRNLALTLHSAYGEDAWSFVPRTYSLPSQLLAWRQRLADEAAHLSSTAQRSTARVADQTMAADATAGTAVENRAAGGTATADIAAVGDTAAGTSAAQDTATAQIAAQDTVAAADCSHNMGLITGWWALKTGQHLGQGLQVVPSSQALSTLLQRNAPHMQAAAAAQQQQQQQRPPQQREQVQQQQQRAPPPPLQQQQQQKTQRPTQQCAGSAGVSDTATGIDSRSSSNAAGTEQSSSSSSSSAPQATTSSSSDPRNPPRPFLSVQQYLTQPLLINNRKFGIRVWVLVIGPKPYRAFIYQQGLVLFSSQQYNPDLSAVQAAGPASQGHLTNAALWGGEAGHASSSSGSSSSSSSNGDSSSSSPANPEQQPVWSLQQLWDLLGQQQAELVTAQIHEAAGKAVAAAAAPVAEAAQQLGWQGDAAFELLGLDFLLDANLKPWLLEVNASPSMAWNVPHQPAASQLMHSTKQQMLTDMFVLLRLQDRYPRAAVDTAAAAAAAGAAGMAETAAAAARGGGTAGGAAASSSSVMTGEPSAAGVAGSNTTRGHPNPLLLRAASQAYFGSRPHIARMVAQAARGMAAAVAAAPTQHDVQQSVLLKVGKELQRQQGAGNEGLTQQQQQQQQQQQEQQHQQQQQQGVDWEQCLQHVVQIECELQSCGGWVSLLPHMPGREEAQQKGWKLHSSEVDAAVAEWLRVRQRG